MAMRTAVIMLCAVLTLSGCATKSTALRPESYYENLSATSASPTLFVGDSKVLSNEDISGILAHRYVPPLQNRIGIVAIGREYWFGWSEELDKLSYEAQSSLIDKLMSSPKVYDASYLPSFLIPNTKTIPLFREAAARYQADLLLIYRSSTRTYEKYRVIRADTSKAYCNVEAVLLDVRTGIIPFAVVSSRDYLAEKKSKDINFQETIRKAQIKALGEALTEVGDSLKKFLEQTEP